MSSRDILLVLTAVLALTTVWVLLLLGPMGW